MDDDPREILAAQAGFVKEVRTSQRATWFPLIVLAIVTFLAIPIERLGRRTIGECGAVTSASSTPHFCRIYSVSGLIYWPIALVIAYAVISNFYKIKSRELGVETSARKYVIPGAAIAILLSAASYLLFLFSSRQRSVLGIYFMDPSNSIIFRALAPAFSICLALLFLARFEKNNVLLVFDLLYGVLVLWPPIRGLHRTGFWSLAPYRVIDGGVLLIVGILFSLTQRTEAKRRV